MNLIKCPICNKKLKQITNSHLKIHNLTIQEFKEKYNIEMISKEVLLKKDTSGHIDYNNKEMKEKHSISGRKGQEKIYEKINGSWKIYKVECNECKKTIETKEREFEFPKKENYYCSKDCSKIQGAKKIKESEEIKLKISKSIKEAWISGIFDNTNYGTYGRQKKY